jgi:valyl-tRNA synthetase
MRKRGFGRKRSLLIAAIVLAISVAAPELDAPAGAVVARAGTRAELQARPAARSARVAKRRKRKVVRRATLTAAQRKARLQSYFRAHPGVVAKKLGKAPVKTAKMPLKKKPAKKKPAKRKKPLTAAARKRRAAAAAAVAARKRRAASAKKKTKSAAAKKKPVKKHALGVTGWTELFFLALLPFAAVAAVLLGTDRARRPREPRAPSPSKRRRTLVITPMRGRR